MQAGMCKIVICFVLQHFASLSGVDPGIPEGGSKIKFMKGEGTGGGAPPPVAGSGAEPQPLF